MLLRRSLTFVRLAIGHWLASHVALGFCFVLWGAWPAPLVVYLFCFPVLLLGKTGVGIVLFGDGSLANSPRAMVVNSLLWTAVVYGTWLLLSLAGSRLAERKAAGAGSPVLTVCRLPALRSQAGLPDGTRAG